jgi:hypothetical protein
VCVRVWWEERVGRLTPTPPRSRLPSAANVPEHYDRLYKSYAAQGARVIALASRPLPEAETDPVATLKAMTREEVETKMVWEGFAVFQARLNGSDDKTPVAELCTDLAHLHSTPLPPFSSRSVPLKRRVSRLSWSWWTRATRS